MVYSTPSELYTMHRYGYGQCLNSGWTLHPWTIECNFALESCAIKETPLNTHACMCTCTRLCVCVCLCQCRCWACHTSKEKAHGVSRNFILVSSTFLVEHRTIVRSSVLFWTWSVKAVIGKMGNMLDAGFLVQYPGRRVLCDSLDQVVEKEIAG